MAENKKSMTENGKRGPGRPPIDATVKCTVMLEPDIHAWATRQTRTLSAMVRSLLAREREEQERPEAARERFLKSVASPKLEEMASFFFGLDEFDQDILITVARSLHEKNMKARVADEVLLTYQAFLKRARTDGS